MKKYRCYSFSYPTLELVKFAGNIPDLLSLLKNLRSSLKKELIVAIQKHKMNNLTHLYNEKMK